MATLNLIPFPNEPSALDIDAHAESVAADAAGDEFSLSGGKRVGFWVKNDHGSETRTVTFAAANLCNHGQLDHAPVPVPAGFEGLIAHDFDSSRFMASSTGMASVTYDNAADLTVAAVLFED